MYLSALVLVAPGRFYINKKSNLNIKSPKSKMGVAALVVTTQATYVSKIHTLIQAYTPIQITLYALCVLIITFGCEKINTKFEKYKSE